MAAFERLRSGPILRILAIAIVYFVAAKSGLLLAFETQQVTTVWPPSGIALATIILFGYRVWPGIALGAFLVSASSNATVTASAGIAFGNALEALLGAALLRRAGFNTSLSRVRDIVALVILAAICSTMVCATIGATSLYMSGVISAEKYIAVWWRWWLGDAAGVWGISPLILTWATIPAPQNRRTVETCTIFLLIFICSYLTLVLGPRFESVQYMIFPLLAWSALRLDMRKTSAACALVTGMALWGMLHGPGAFGTPGQSMEERLGLLMLFSGVTSVTVLSMGALAAEHTQALDALRQSEEQLLMALEAGRMGVWNWDVKSGTIQWSENLGAIHRLSRSEYPDNFKAYAESIHPQDREEMIRSIHRALTQGTVFSAEYRSVRPDGSVAWYTTRGHTVYNSAGKPIRMVGLCADVTERKLAEVERRHARELLERQVADRTVALRETVSQLHLEAEERKAAEVALRASQAKFRALLESAPDAFVIVDCDGMIVLVNAQTERAFGYTREELIGQAIDVLLPKSFRHTLLQTFLANPSARQQNGDFDLCVLRKDGTEVPVDISLSPLHSEKGLLVTAAIRDMTERKRAERALRESEARYRALIEHSPDAIVISRDSKIVFVNPAGLELFGAKDISQLLGKSLFDISHPDYHALVRERLQAVAEGKLVPLMEKKIIRLDGELRDVEAVGSRYPNHEGSAIQVILRDITERKRAEASLAEEARRKDQFLAVLAHELRNPLAPVRNAVEVLKIPGQPQDVINRAIEIIGRQVAHMAHLVDDLLDVSRISHGKILLRKQRLNLVQLLEIVIDEHSSELMSKHLNIESKIPDEPIWVNGDPTRLTQIVDNLLYNAVKFTPPGGRITIATGRDAAFATISVRDTGIGMDQDLMERMFQPFSQGDRSRDRSGGLGLGLALTRGLVELHGGRISATSAGIDQGSEFKIWLPVAESPARTEIQPIAPPSGGPFRILVVEDNIDAADSLMLLLESLGHQVRVAYDGKNGLKIAREFSPEVMICDIGLPNGMDGYQFAVQVHNTPSIPQAYLIAMTGYGQGADRRRAREAGFDAHLTKPADLARIKTLLNQTVPEWRLERIPAPHPASG